MALFAHANLRIDAVTDVPGVERRIRRGMNDHVARSPGIDSAVIDGNPRHTHGITKGCELDVPAFTVGGLRGNIRRLDDEHAAILRSLRIRFPIVDAILYRNANRPAIGKNLAFRQREIVIGFHHNPATVGLYLSADHSDVAAGREDDALIRCRGRSGPLYARGIDDTLSIRIRSCIRRRIKSGTCPKERRAFQSHILFRRNQDTVLRIDLPGDGNRRAILRIPLQLRRLTCERQAKETGIAENRFPHRSIGAQSETPHIDDTVGADSDAFIREEIHIAADLPILQRIHHAIDFDLVIDHIDLVIHFP